MLMPDCWPCNGDCKLFGADRCSHPKQFAPGSIGAECLLCRYLERFRVHVGALSTDSVLIIPAQVKSRTLARGFIVAPVRVRRTRTTRTRCVPVRTRFCVMTSGVRQPGAARNKQL